MLTDVGVRNAKPREKAFKLGDEKGLYLITGTASGERRRSSHTNCGASRSPRPYGWTWQRGHTRRKQRPDDRPMAVVETADTICQAHSAEI